MGTGKIGLSRSLAWFFLILGIVILLIYLYQSTRCYFVLGEAMDDKFVSDLASFIGGVIGPFWALAGVLFFVDTLYMQQKDIINQRHEFNVNRVSDILFKQLERIEMESVNARLFVKDQRFSISDFNRALLMIKKFQYSQLEELVEIRKKGALGDPDVNSKAKAEDLASILSIGLVLGKSNDSKKELFDSNLVNMRGFVDKIASSIDIIDLLFNKSNFTEKDKVDMMKMFYGNLDAEIQIVRELNSIYPYKFKEQVKPSEVLAIENQISFMAHIIMNNYDKYHD